MTTGFIDQSRTHVLMITNHGVHEWHVVPGMPDTGGQNVYVNQFTEALIAQGYRVTIVNRGGYPNPSTALPQTGVRLHPSGHGRILYIEDGYPDFIRKEEMTSHLPRLAEDLASKLADEDDTYHLIISHYWDAGVLGAMLNNNADIHVPHVWVPHSLGAMKKHNTDPSTWANLHIDERIELETVLLAEIDGAVATSTAIRDSLLDDYGYKAKYFLPPCVDVNRYRPDIDCNGVLEFLAGHSAITAAELRRRLIITEISRTDRTKRKDILIKAFAQVRRSIPNAFLAVALDPSATSGYDEATRLIRDLHLEDHVAVLGSVWEQLPCLYAASAVYCTPSVMEGFGMSAEEAAATGVPIVASDLVPFATEYLLGGQPAPIAYNNSVMLQGAGAIVVPADDVDGFAAALTRLLDNEQLRAEMGAAAYYITVPYFTWATHTRALLDGLGITPTPGTAW